MTKNSFVAELTLVIFVEFDSLYKIWSDTTSNFLKAVFHKYYLVPISNTLSHIWLSATILDFKSVFQFDTDLNEIWTLELFVTVSMLFGIISKFHLKN